MPVRDNLNGGKAHYLHRSWKLSDGTRINETFTANSKCTALIDILSLYGIKIIYVNDVERYNGNFLNISIPLERGDVIRVYVEMDAGNRLGLIVCTIASDTYIQNNWV